MSHDIGAVKFKDGDFWFYEYNGTCDVVMSHIYPTKEEVYENWREGEWINPCACMESVMLYSNYGGGFYFKGKACRFHRCVQESPTLRFKGTMAESWEVVWIKPRDMKEDWAANIIHVWRPPRI